MANPFAEDVSFEEFLNRYSTGGKPVKQGLNRKADKPAKPLDLQQQVQKAEKLLQGFVPPQQKGGGS